MTKEEKNSVALQHGYHGRKYQRRHPAVFEYARAVIWAMINMTQVKDDYLNQDQMEQFISEKVEL
jgi:hypothetical protein